MRGRETIGLSRGARLLVLALAAGLLVGVLATPAVAKKNKNKGPAVTRTASVPLAPSAQASGTAHCPGKTHVTGGGWSVANPYSANGTDPIADDTGTRINHVQSQPVGLRNWIAGAAALANPSGATTFTSFARCESNPYSSTISAISQTSTVPVGEGRNLVLNCAPNAHVLTGGFSFGPPGDLADPFATRASVYESRRTDPRTWTIHLINPNSAPSPVTITVNFLCELNRKGTQVSEASSATPIVDNGRTSATATCTGKAHSVAGGFLISPTEAGAVPAVGVDQMQPVGAKAWQVGLFEYPTFGLPAGSSVTAYSYCKKNALPKK
jgi:hypothetical protein